MWKETDIVGIYMAPIVPYAVAALLLLLALRPLLARFGFRRWAWNTPLAETALYVCILALLVRFF